MEDGRIRDRRLSQIVTDPLTIKWKPGLRHPNMLAKKAKTVPTLFLIFLARFAYFSVFRVSIKSRSDGLIHAIIMVRLSWIKKTGFLKEIKICALKQIMRRYNLNHDSLQNKKLRLKINNDEQNMRILEITIKSRSDL